MRVGVSVQRREGVQLACNVPPPSAQPARHIVRIIGRNAKQYKVLWNDPPDTWTLESISWLDSQEEHRALVEEFRKRVEDAEVID